MTDILTFLGELLPVFALGGAIWGIMMWPYEIWTNDDGLPDPVGYRILNGAALGIAMWVALTMVWGLGGLLMAAVGGG